MLNRKSSFRFVLSLFTITAICAITAAANWGSGFAGLNFFALAESAFSGNSSAPDQIPFVPTVTATVGSGGTYATLKAAFDDINAGAGGLTGSIELDIVGDTVETAPAVLNASGTGSASYTAILIQPTGGAARTITGAIAAGSPLIDFNGADNVTINGLNTGGNSLTISNTTVSATSGTSTIRFIGGATGNTITNSSILGSGSMSVATNGANIFFSTDANTANGNDNNTITNNNIGPAGANLSTKGILCNGSTSTTAIGDSGLVIDNNNIFDYFGAAVTSAGIAVNGGCNGFSITNNRFYQTGTRTWTTGAEHNAILLNSSTATSGVQGMTITGNTIGYASNTQTGTYALTGSTGTFRAIRYNGITAGTTSNINNNTIASVALTGVTSSGTSTSSPFAAILINNGLVVTNNNNIGSQGANGSLTFSTTTTTSTDVYGFYNFSVDNWTATGNNIGGISATNLAASGTFVLYGMRVNTSTSVGATFTSNNVGGTVADSIQLNATGTASQVIGMQTANGAASWASNKVRNLTSNIGTGTTTGASLIGMNITTTTPNHTVSQNTISNLNNTNATAASVVTGIQFTGGTANIVERNLIYGLGAATNSTSAEINGIRIAGGTNTFRNNMIALGAGVANAIGTGVTGGISGINEALGTNNVFHNSIYIGGNPTAGVGPSFAFNGQQTVNTRSFRDNIFYNARSNSGATGKNYIVRVGGSSANPTGLTINNNLYYSDGTGAVFGYFNLLDVADLAGWKTAVGQDTGSFFANPQYLAPTSSTPDLHLSPTLATVAEGNGADVGVTDDFDGQTRASFTPVDIGADAGNFNGVDLAPPVISYTGLANTNLTTNRVLSVTLTDVTGVATGGSAPRIYFNKNAGTYFSTSCALAGGTVQNGTWNCTIDYSLVGGVVTADVIRYFVVAQDTLGNLASNPSAGFSGTNVNTVTTPPTTPNSYLIAQAISGTKTVCASGCDYATLTGATGIFKAINDGVATGNINIEISSDLTTGEDGTNGLNALAEQPAGSNFTVRIYPTGGPRAITGSANTALIRTVGASRVTIDGSIGGTGTDRSLTITNTSVTTPSVVLFGSVGTTPISNNTLKNCVVINGVNTSSAVVISDGTTLGSAGVFSNITIQNNDVQKAFVGVFATGGTTPQGGSNLTYADNKVNTIGANAVRDVGLYMQGVNGATVTNNTVGNIDKANDENDVGIWLATGTINATVSGNTISGIGYTGTGAFAPIGINLTPGVASANDNIFTNNISDISSSGSTQVRGLAVTGASSDITIQRNKIQGVINTNTGTFGAYGMDISGGNNVVVKNNFVSNISGDMTGGAAFSTTFGIFGIRVGAGTGHQIYNNSVNLFGARAGTATSSLLTAAFGVVATTSTGMDVRDNIFANNITGGTTSIANVSVYLPSAGTSAMNLTWNNNSYYFGTDAARQGVGQAGTTAGTNFFTTLPLLAAYSAGLSPAATNDNASIASTGAVPFLTSTDLHIPLGSPEIDTGATLASVTNDIDGDPRPTGPAYDIGADEQPDLTAPDTQILTNPTNPSTSANATFTFSGTDSVAAVVASFECQLDAASYTTCTSPANYTSLSQGSHTFNVRAKDAAGNVDPTPATYTWVVDAIAPDTQILTTPPNPSNTSSPTFTFSGTDSVIASVASFECSVDADPFTPCTSPATPTGLLDGSRLFRVRAVDAAGNVDPTPASYSWVIDTVAPDTSITGNPTDPSSDPNPSFTFTNIGTIANGKNEPNSVSITFECKLDAAAFASCTSPKSYTAVADGSHTFQVRATDVAGNTDPTPASYTWTIATGPTGPVIVNATAGTTGPTSYATLKAAFDAINAGTHQGAIAITLSGDTTEAASAVLNASGSGSALYTSISIKPTGGAARTVSGNIAGHLIDLNGANNVTIDGLNTGGNSLTISNTSQQVSASTIRFVNDASNNIVTNSTVSGATGAALSSGFGVIYFAGGVTTGNDNNTISNNNITAAGGAQPINGIYSFGTSAAIDNSGEIISGNNISDYFNTNSSSNGINVNTGSSTWTITNNKFFQTGTRTYLTAATHNGINVLTGSGYTITGNTIGYAAANGTGTYTMTGTVATRFFGINLAVGTTADTSVQGNTIASIAVSGIGTNSGCGTLCGVSITSGNVNVGNVTPNTFGSTTGTGSLTATPTTTTAAAVIGINTGSTGNIVITNNTFGGFTSSSPTAANPGSVFGIDVTGAATSLTITGNTIGNTTADNMRAGVLGTTTGSSIAGGIIASAIPAVYNYSNNTIRNISSYGTSTSAYVRGIQTGTTSSATAVATINNNTITNLTTSGAVTSISSGNAAAQGIQFLPGINSTISGNTISNISDINTGAVASVVAGITHGSATNTVISKNVIFGLSNASTNTSTTTPGVITGIAIRSGTTAVTVVNNMISLGNGQSTNTAVIGIWGNHGSTPDPTDQIYFNTVNIEGTVASGAQPSMGFLRGDLTATARTAPVDVRNNIFNNNRSGGTGKHYAIANDYGATTTATGWASGASNNNVLNSNAATVGFWTTDQTFSGWKAASASDSLSYSGIPVSFVNSASNLHLNMGVTPTSLESGGVAIAGYTTDIDGQTRPGPAGSTNGGAFAPDLGADEFDGVYLDSVAPVITYSTLSNLTSTANRTLSVNITDGTGVDSGGNSPRIYFKKSTDGAYVSTACSLASGTPQNGNYNCVINYALLGGGAVATGDTVQYFVVAQDTVGNLASNPAVGFSGTSVNTVTTPPTTPNAYLISAPFSGTFTVGTGGNYTSLTNAGGIFEALNNGVITGNVQINIISDLTGETGTVSLNQTTEEGSGGYTIKIQPTGAPRSITGSSTSWIIRLADADRVTIDGSLTGGTATGVGGDPSLRNLTIQNTSTTATAGAVIAFSSVSNGAQNDTVRNVNVLGQDPTQTLIGIHIGGATPGSAGGPNTNARVENCTFQKAIIGIYDAGASAAAQNTGNVVTMNDLSATGTSKLRRAGMLFFNHDGLQVTMNSVGGIADDEGADTYGIGVGIQSYTSTVITSGAITNSVISRNKVNGVSSTSTTGFTAVGIGISGGSTGPNVVSNNMVTGVNAPSTSPDLVAGIFVAGATGSSTKLYFNSVSMTGDRGVVASQIGSFALAVTGTDPTVELKDNIFYTTQTSGGGTSAKSYAIGMQTSTFANLDSNYNDFVSTGANAGGFRIGSIDTAGTDLATISAWQTTTSKDANSLALDPLFVDPLANLHLQGASTMINAGLAAGGVTIDIDGDTRVGTPDIGADEIDQTAPDTQILTFPSNPSTSSSATFTFSGTDAFANAVASFECKLDAGAFAACTSPANYTGLSQGTHNFQVRAIDGAGNVDPTPASYTWTVDAIAPDTQLLTFPSDPSNSANATFTFSGTDSFGTPSITFECKLDAGSFAACTSPKSYTGLADGSHTFQVRAKDVAGNVDPTPASYTWNIVTTLTGPVTITATAGTAGPTDYPTLQAAFDAINAGTHQGAVTVNVVTNTTETAPAVLNSSGAGSALYTSVLVRPYNDGVTVSGATATGRGLVELNGADNVTIDGDNPNTAGTNRNLTFQNTAANTVTFTSVIRIALATTIVTSADNDTIKNVNVIGSASGRNIAAATSSTGPENTTFGIFAGPGASTVSATTAPSAVTSVSTSVGSGATAVNLLVSNNNVTVAGRGISVNGSATTVFPGVKVQNNLVGNPTAGAVDQIYAVGITVQGAPDGVVSGNTVWVEGYVGSSAAGHGIDAGVNSATGTFTIDSNKVNRVRANNGGTWSAYGINLGGGSNHVVQNNFVSGVINDQTAGTGGFSTTFGAYGIRVASGTGHKVYHNSVNMYGPMGGVTNADLTAAFGITAATLTGVDVRNNIFANSITGGNPAGTRNVAFYLPTAATVTMNLTDNNNAYFVGTDANNRLAQTGTTFGTGEYLAANFDPNSTSPATNFRAYTSTLSAAGTNDNASFVKTTAAPFTSSSDLHIPNATVTQLESAGAAVGVAVDIDGQSRPNGTAPDIGADEFTGVLPPANDIAATAFVVPANGSTLPSGTSGQPQASFSNVGLAAQTNVNVQFTVNGPGGYTYTDTKVIASIGSGSTVTVTFAAVPTLVPGSYTMSAAVTTPDANSSNDVINGGFNAVPPLSGTVTVGAGGNYTSLTNPGGLFDTLNLLGASGPVVANITADLTSETGAIALNEFGNSLTIKPSGAARTISGNGAALGMIRLFGADNVTIDGSLSGGTDRSLTITYGNTGGTVIWIGAASASNGANGNTIKNCNISGNTGTTIIAGILGGSGTTLGSAAEFPNNNNTVQNNWIYRVQNGIYNQGAVAFDQNWNVVGNTFGSTVAADKNTFRGMLMGNAQNFTINGNVISGIQSTATTTAAMSGIQLAFTLNGGFVVNNTIRDIKNVSASGTGAYGMQIGSTSSAANVTIANNFVSDITGLGSATVTSNGFGINVNGTGAGGYKIYHNSINMNTNQTTAATGSTAALYVGTGVTATGALDVRDNIFANTQTSGATPYAVYSAAAASVFSSINYNDYFATNVGFLGSAQATLANWQTATGQDANSFSVNPAFVSSTDLHLAAGSPMINAAFTLAGVTSDIDGQTRPIGAANDIGADEWVANVAVSGRVLTSDGQGIKNVLVSLVDGGTGSRVYTITGPFGYYSFANVPTGVSYTLSVNSKRFTFTPNFHTFTPYADRSTEDFVADPLTLVP